MIIILGLLFVIIGVGLCGLAGTIREKNLQVKQNKSTGNYNFKYGFFICIVSGIFSAMLNLAFVFGKPIADIAKDYIGNLESTFSANSPIWSLALTGAFITNLLYCGILLLGKKTWRKYVEQGTRTYWFWTMLMGILWFSGVTLYGAGASSLGEIGVTVAWIILMAVTGLVGNIWGILSGEWKDIPKSAHQYMIKGLSFLIVSIFLVSLGQYLSP
jgi:L-rhamnose-H+ transport protein